MQLGMTIGVGFKEYLVKGEEELDTMIEQLPEQFELTTDLSLYKRFEMVYFSPVTLVDGLERRGSNIKSVHAIVLDLDNVENKRELLRDLGKIIIADFYMWDTISSFSDEGHKNGTRLVFPLREPINPWQLENAAKDMLERFKRMGFNADKFGVDRKAMIDPARLSGFALQKTNTYHNTGKKYRVNPNTPAVKREVSDEKRGDGVDDPERFIKNYIRKHHVERPVLGKNVHNTLQRLIGVLEIVGCSQEETIEALSFMSDYCTRGIEDIEHEVLTSNAYK